LGAIDIERKNIAAQQARLGERRRIVVTGLEALESARNDLDQNLQSIVAELTDLQTKLTESAKEAAALGRQIADISQQLGSAREHRSALLSRQKLLQDLEASREGFTEGVKSILRQRDSKFPFIRGVVADVLRVDVEYAHVIEAALDGRDQMLICDDSNALSQSDLSILEGRVNILSPTPSPGTPGEGWGEDSSLNVERWTLNVERSQTIEESLPFGPNDKSLL